MSYLTGITKKDTKLHPFTYPPFVLPFLLLISFIVGIYISPTFTDTVGDSTHSVQAAVTKKDAKDEVPKDYIPIYQAAAKKFGIPWTFLASTHNQETTFSQNVQSSSAGAIGHTQFMRCTWVGNAPNCKSADESVYTSPATIKKYGGNGMDGNQDGKADPMDIVDAVYSTAKLTYKAYASGGAKAAAKIYNNIEPYVSEVVARDKRYQEAFKDSSPKGTLDTDGKMKDGNWLKGVSSGKDGKVKGSVSSTDDTESDSDSDSDSKSESKGEASVSPFAKYKNHVSNAGVKTKEVYGNTTVNYQANKLLETVSAYLMILSRILGAILFGFLSFLWLFVLLARTNFPPAQSLVLKMTGGKIDANEDLNKLFKYTAYGFIFSVVAVSGLIPKVFVLIYTMILYIIDFVTYSI